MWSSSRSKPASSARRVAATNSSRTASMSARVISRGTWLTPGRYGSGDGAISGQLPSGERLVLALPHAASSSPCGRRGRAARRSPRAECACTKSTIRFHAAACSSRVQPAAAGRDPPVGATCRSSRSSPARRRRSPRAPRWTRWKSPGVPSTDEYMSIGETTTRLASSSPRSRNGVNIGGRVAERVDRRDELRVAQPQVAVGDPARCGSAG